VFSLCCYGNVRRNAFLGYVHRTGRLEANDQEKHMKNHYQSLWEWYNLWSEMHDVVNYANSLSYFKNILRILWILTSSIFKLEWRARMLHIQAVPLLHLNQKTGYPDWRSPLFTSVTADKQRNSRDYTHLRSTTVPVSIKFNTVTLHRSYKAWFQQRMLWTQIRMRVEHPWFLKTNIKKIGVTLD